MISQSKPLINACGVISFLSFSCVLTGLVASCTAADDPSSRDKIIEPDSLTAPAFPDSTNLHNAADSLRFAELCIFDHDRNDIADRYFRAIVAGWNRRDTCNEPVSGAFRWLGWEERRRPAPDTATIFGWLDSSILACPGSPLVYSGYGSMLLEFGRKGSEHYFNLAMQNGDDLYHVSECIRGHYDIVDTNKLSFDRMNDEEMRTAEECSAPDL